MRPSTNVSTTFHTIIAHEFCIQESTWIITLRNIGFITTNKFKILLATNKQKYKKIIMSVNIVSKQKSPFILRVKYIRSTNP